jgi:glycerol-3-phosphate O-acyltransferase/dihydroxyacetone phosphate acyltransferase
VFILAKVISHKKAKGAWRRTTALGSVDNAHAHAEALAASTVKIQGRDVLATWKVLVSLAVVPLLYVIYTLTATLLAYRYDVFPTWRHWIPLIMVFLLPSLGYSALKFGEAGMDVAK